MPGTVLSLALDSFDRAMYFEPVPALINKVKKANNAEKGVCPLR